LRLAAIYLLLALSACQPGSVDNSPGDPSASGNDTAAEEKARREAVAAAQLPPKPKTTPKVIAGANSMESTSVAPSRQDLCWQDYCPCEHPETGLDHTICRNARAGVEMSDDQWSIGAMARDVKRSGDESNRQMDEVMRDTEAQRRELRSSQLSESAPTDD
jgi:hypothetical protein